MKTRVVRIYHSAIANYAVEKKIDTISRSMADDYRAPHGVTLDGLTLWETVYCFATIKEAEAFAEKLSRSDQEPEVVKEFG